MPLRFQQNGLICGLVLLAAAGGCRNHAPDYVGGRWGTGTTEATAPAPSPANNPPPRWLPGSSSWTPVQPVPKSAPKPMDSEGIGAPLPESGPDLRGAQRIKPMPERLPPMRSQQSFDRSDLPSPGADESFPPGTNEALPPPVSGKSSAPGPKVSWASKLGKMKLPGWNSFSSKSGKGDDSSSKLSPEVDATVPSSRANSSVPFPAEPFAELADPEDFDVENQTPRSDFPEPANRSAGSFAPSGSPLRKRNAPGSVPVDMTPSNGRGQFGRNPNSVPEGDSPSWKSNQESDGPSLSPNSSSRRSSSGRPITLGFEPGPRHSANTVGFNQDETPRAKPLNRGQGAAQALAQESVPAFEIDALVLCSRVHGYNDFVALDSRRLRPGQTLLIYATLKNVHWENSTEEFRTKTFSAVDVCRASGEVLAHLPLGTRVHTQPVIPCNDFISYEITVPTELQPGAYVLRLQTYDLLAQRVCHAQIPIRVN